MKTMRHGDDETGRGKRWLGAWLLLLLLSHGLLVSLSPCLAQTVGQWELRKRGSGGMTSYGVTAEDGKAIGFSSGVPAMITVGGTLTIDTSAVSGGTIGNVLYHKTGNVLGELDLSTLYQPLDADLTTLAGLANSSGALTNNGSGTFRYAPASEPPAAMAYVHETAGNDSNPGTVGEPFATAQAAYDAGYDHITVLSGDAGTLNISADPTRDSFYIMGRAGAALSPDSGETVPFIPRLTGANPVCEITVSNNAVTSNHTHIYSNKAVVINYVGHGDHDTGATEVQFYHALVGTVTLTSADGITDLGNPIGALKNGVGAGYVLFHDCSVIGPVATSAGAAGEDIDGVGSAGDGGSIFSYDSIIAGAMSIIGGQDETAGKFIGQNSILASAPTVTTKTYRCCTVAAATYLGTVSEGSWNGTAIGAAYGGTGRTTLTANNVILGNGTSAVNFVAPGTSGNVLTSNGTTWTSAAASGGGVEVSDTAYNATTWNGSTLAASQNAIRDKIETMTGTGSVTSVAMTVPAFLSITGSPITTSGTLAVTLSGTALPVANGGTGATALTDLITLATHTTGNYVATIADSGAAEVTVTNSGTENAGVTLAIAAGITRDVEWDTLAEINAATTDADALATNGSGASLTGIPTSIAGTANQITASAATGAVTLSLPATITGLTSVTSTGFTGALTGNASTATALATARTIGGTSFDGTGNIVPATITVADTADATSFVAIFESATGDLAPKTDAALTYDASNGTLSATTFAGAGGGLTLDASGFNGNLATTDNTLQEVAQKVDDLSVGGGSGGNWVLVSTTTISGSPTTLDFDVSTGYRKYRLELDSVICGADGYVLQIRTSTDSGATYDSGASDYNYAWGPSGTYSPTQGTAAEISTGATIGTDAGEGWSGEIDIYEPGAVTNRPLCQWSLFGPAYSAASYNIITGAARRNTAADVDHVRLLFQSSNSFESGVVRLFRWSE